MKVYLHYPGGRTSRARRSPDGQLNEAIYTRKICLAIQRKLRLHNQDTSLITDTSIKRIIQNQADCQVKTVITDPPSAKLLISVRLNQERNDGAWHLSKGWSSIDNEPSSTKCSIGRILTAHALQTLGADAASRPDQPDGLQYIKQAAILDAVQFPAAVTYNLYLDNKENAHLLRSGQTMDAIVRLHTGAILEYIKLNG